MFTPEMQKALEVDAQKLRDQGVPVENPILWDTSCYRCGNANENKFSWDGQCLVCEEGDDDFTLQDE